MYTNCGAGLGLLAPSTAGIPPLELQNAPLYKVGNGDLEAFGTAEGRWYDKLQFDPYLYWLASRRGLVPATTAGYFTVMAAMSGNDPQYNAALAAGEPAAVAFAKLAAALGDVIQRGDVQRAIDASLAANATRWQNPYTNLPHVMAAPFLDAAIDAALSGAVQQAAALAAGVRNPVSGVTYPLDQIAYAGPNPLFPDTQTMLQLQNGDTWTWEGRWTGAVIGTPNVPASYAAAMANAAAATEAARLAARVLSAHTYEFVVRPSQSQAGKWVQVAQRDSYHYTDGSVDIGHWTLYDAGAPLTFEEQLARPDTTAVLKLTDLTPAEWAAIQADFAASGITPQAPPAPYIPGSHVYVPAPGTGGETTILLPGATVPVPVSSLTPEQIATETAAQSAQYGPPAGGTAPATPSTPAYAVPGGGYPSPVMQEGEPAGAPVAPAGIGKSLLIGGGILAAVLFFGTKGGRSRRPRGYRRY